jgi:hypothetical protein
MAPVSNASAASPDFDAGRAQWVDFAHRLIAGARRHVSPTGARIQLPGAAGGYGRDIDGLEGFARTLLVVGFCIAGERGEGVDDLIEFAIRGVAAGVDPANPERWVRLDEHPQAKVEAASTALILDLTRDWVWERLDAETRGRVVDYLAPAVGDASYPRTNWLWFRLVVQTFLRSVGGPWSRTDVDDGLALHDSFVRADGWLSDGEERSYDHYAGWALHLYPILWSRMRGATELAGGRTTSDVARLDRYLQDAIALVGADGSPLIQGRSLIYRFAAAAPFWVGAIAGVPSIGPGALRHAAGRVVGHFAEHGVPDSDDVLSMGWHGPWRRLAQSYSGPGSPYWAVKGLLGVSLPADDPVWAAPVEPLPVETRDELRAVRAPGWIVSGTHADGIVRVVNHGTDHALPGTLTGDSPLYARLGYSTATSPLLDDAAWRDPLEQSVALVDHVGRVTHRAALEPRGVAVEDGVGYAASTWLAHLLDPEPRQIGHGSGLVGAATVLGRVTVQSIVRGPWELRIVWVGELETDIDASKLRLRIGGWPVAAGVPVDQRSDEASATASASGLSSSLSAVTGRAAFAVATRIDASPLGGQVAVPVAEFAVPEHEHIAVLLGLGRTTSGGPARLELEAARGALEVSVAWPDGIDTTARLADPRLADPRAADHRIVQSTSR